MKSYIFFAMIISFATYLFTPTLAIDFYDFWSLLFIFSLIFIIVLGTIEIFDRKKHSILVVICIVSFLGAVVFPILTSWSLFHDKEYANLIETKNKIEISKFSEDISPVDVNNIRQVDQQLASKLGSKLLGENLTLSSTSELGTFRIQLVNNKLYWVAPLLHRGFFKWINNKAGTKGYAMVSATNGKDIKLVLDKGLIKYQPNAYFGTEIRRHVWLNGYMNTGFTDITFEVNEQGKGYWVISRFDKTIGYHGEDVVGTIIVDPETGEMNEYSIEDTPKWVDRIQPQHFVEEQLSDNGSFKKGWFNANFTQEEVITPTEGMSLVYGKDNNSYWYTGMRGKGRDGSTIGFMLVNTRTKVSKFYRVSGATETKSKNSAEGLVQEKGYYGTNPILYNVLGIPTYILTLKDNEGLVKNVAMVSVKHYETVGIGINIKDALRNYKSKVLSTGNKMDIDSSIELKEIIGTVSRVNTDIKNGNSYYYLKLKTHDKIFILDSSLSEYIILTAVEDSVKIKFEDSNSKFITVNQFNNISLKDYESK